MTSNTFINHFNEQITNEGRILILDFFITFSRFEFALKASLTFANGDNRKVEPNWESFISSIRETFNVEKNEKIKNAVAFIFDSPPKVQALIGNNLQWIDREFNLNTPNINKLCLHIRDIRNNLFHGGKFNENYEHDVSRNYNLINSAMIVLNEWLELNLIVQRIFLQPIF